MELLKQIKFSKIQLFANISILISADCHMFAVLLNFSELLFHQYFNQNYLFVRSNHVNNHVLSFGCNST